MNNINNNIILIGFMGSGKTSVGRKLALKLDYEFFDTDLLIEANEGITINDIFKNSGEEYFRELESKLLHKLRTSLNHAVLSTGGGMPLREQNGQLLKELGFVVYLEASCETTLNRLKGDSTRPLLQGNDLATKISSILELRRPIYKNIAHIMMDTDDRSLDDIAETIINSYSDYCNHE